jgi:hypothetical protein
VHVVYTTESFRIDYADSTNLTTSGPSGTAVFSTAQNSNFSANNISAITNKDPGETRIHKNYYLWTQNLATYIMQSLGEAKNKSETSNAKTECGSVPNKLRELDALRKEGVITTEEYQKKKQQLLQQL